jgi:hypothetical protein
VERRLQLTAAAATAWRPRLELLIRIRKLKPFDKWVIVTLVAAVISLEVRTPGFTL